MDYFIQEVVLIDGKCHEYPDYVRETIYTQNAIDAVHHQLSKLLTKTQDAFLNENSLMKLLYVSNKWTMPIHSLI